MPGNPLFSLTAGKAVRYRVAEPQEDPMRRTLSLCLLVVSCVLSVAEAGQANRCRRACRAAVDDCVATTHRRRACRKQLIRACRQHGAAACDITPATTTTSPVLPTAGTGLDFGCPCASSCRSIWTGTLTLNGPTTTVTVSTTTTSTNSTSTTSPAVRDYGGDWTFVGSLAADTCGSSTGLTETF